MRNFFLLLSLACALLVTSCGPEQLDREQAARLLQEGKAYPKVVEYRVFCGNNETAQSMHDAGLVEQGYVTAQLAHTVDDVGKPLIAFTEKSQPFIVSTPTIDKSIDVQIVKLADEHFREITKITLNATGERAEVEYTTSLKNITPFAALSHQRTDSIQTRMTYFTRSKDGGWKWDGKIIKTQS